MSRSLGLSSLNLGCDTGALTFYLKADRGLDRIRNEGRRWAGHPFHLIWSRTTRTGLPGGFNLRVAPYGYLSHFY